MDFVLEIQPAIPMEDTLERIGYEINGGGTMMDESSCDISFSKED